MNEQTEKLGNVMAGTIWNYSELNKLDSFKMADRMLKVCKEAELKFVIPDIEMCINYDPLLTLNCAIPDHRGGIRCHSTNLDCAHYKPTSESQIKEIEVE